MAKEIGVRVAIGTDSHSVPQLDNMFFGVATARRGWMEKKDVLNTLPLKELVSYLSG
jgi:DNA polymerase (family 10)